MCAKAPGACIQAAQPGRLLPQPSPSWTLGREWKLGRAGVAAVGAPERLSLLMAGRLFPHHPPRRPSAQLGTRAIPLGSTDASGPSLCPIPVYSASPLPPACTSPGPCMSVRRGHPQDSMPNAQTPQILRQTSAHTCLRCLNSAWPSFD